MMCAIGFYVGVRVEKGHIASSPTTIGTGGGFAARAARRGRPDRPQAGRPPAGRPAAASGAAGGRGRPARRARRHGRGGFRRPVRRRQRHLRDRRELNGKTLTLTEASGDTVKVS